VRKVHSDPSFAVLVYGLLAHHGADEVKIACSGTYTRDAEAFAKDKPIRLIGGEELLRMVGEVQTTPVQTTRAAEVFKPAPVDSTPAASLACPKCGKPMIERAIAGRGKSSGDVKRFLFVEACDECGKVHSGFRTPTPVLGRIGRRCQFLH